MHITIISLAPQIYTIYDYICFLGQTQFSWHTQSFTIKTYDQLRSSAQATWISTATFVQVCSIGSLVLISPIYLNISLKL